ncbi:hypothetical protein ACPCHQ_11760 [Ralstonia thomasii]|jgi:hypothetical protein|uniref:Uncharacterized protein n=2 Tax=Ralstonia TaxID=48736 RepID=A0ABN9ISV8_9RALS|nr:MULTISPECIES: hypothetical protein [Ralstonia]MBT2177756.1 hypothetical protein [Ralstonia pickettii]CAJ0710629.1 hypothetical protein LMG7143_01656 [Ralstonia sp. LMG 18095]CAJ0792100.1 hypothetical protein LMG18095_02266 [Ralstonia sp. LMG 18095]
MINALTSIERQVCEAMLSDDTFCMERGLDEPQPYMAAIARAMLNNELDDNAMAALGRAMVQQFQRDIADAVAEQECDNEMAADILEAEEEARAKCERSLGMTVIAIH